MTLPLDLELVIRLGLASVLGAAVGFERELHDHPAGMRTHLLVALGACLFTMIGAYGFADVGRPTSSVDPTRIAAQIVSGIGFLGAGAILHQGLLVRGLTTAASLWAVAAIGLAVGAGGYLLGVVGTVIVVFSLWPLRWLVLRFGLRQSRSLRLRLEINDLTALGGVTERVVRAGASLTALDSRKTGKGRYEIVLGVRLSPARNPNALINALNGLPDVEVTEMAQSTE